MRLLLLSAYDAQSHLHWRQSLEEGFADWQWTQLSLPPRYFSWRQRGNSLSWGFSHKDTLEAPYDALIVTSMVDLSALRGFVPALAKLPTLVYFHENQFEYPASTHQRSPVEVQLNSIYTALCADRLVFNSDYNRRSFLSGAKDLLKKMPDQVPIGLVERLESRATVIPVPLSLPVKPLSSKPVPVKPGSSMPKSSTSKPIGASVEPLILLWNHRWEYDKGPDRLLAMLRVLLSMAASSEERNFPAMRFNIVGQSFRRVPKEFDEIKNLLQQLGMLGEWGYLSSREAYWQCLDDSDAVISTAVHDFQGLSVLEAVAKNCVPLVPRRLVYPEWFGEQACYEHFEDTGQEARELAERIVAMAEQKANPNIGLKPSENLPSGGSDFSWRALESDYREAILGLKALGPK